jgi:hypothetical protein
MNGQRLGLLVVSIIDPGINIQAQHKGTRIRIREYKVGGNYLKVGKLENNNYLDLKRYSTVTDAKQQ